MNRKALYSRWLSLPFSSPSLKYNALKFNANYPEWVQLTCIVIRHCKQHYWLHILASFFRYQIWIRETLLCLQKKFMVYFWLGNKLIQVIWKSTSYVLVSKGFVRILSKMATTVNVFFSPQFECYSVLQWLSLPPQAERLCNSAWGLRVLCVSEMFVQALSPTVQARGTWGCLTVVIRPQVGLKFFSSWTFRTKIN